MILLKKNSSNLLLTIIGCFVIAIMLFRASHYKSALQTKHWPHVTGTIVRSQLYHQNPNSIHDSYQPNISYSYQVNGINYQGETLFKGDKSMGFSTKTFVQQMISRFPEGKTVMVYYSPLQAQSAVLIPGPIKLHYLYLLMAISASLVGGYCLRLLFLKH